MGAIVEHTFASGVRRLTLPLPTGPRHVHCYLIDGLLVDTGLGLDGPDWGAYGVDRIAITHFHPDHVGGAEAAAAATGAAVVQGRADYEQCERVWGSDDWPERMAAWFVRHGVPADEAHLLIEQGHAFAPFIRFACKPHLVDDGDEIDGWQVVAMGGHADGHIVLVRDEIMLAGDHLLTPISPAVGLYPESRPDPLGDYVASLERTIELAPGISYGGHGEPITDPASRARELIDHHARRLDETAAALTAEPQTAFDVSRAVFGPQLPPTQRRFAVAETLSHLERLVHAGGAVRGGDGGAVSYTAM
jgi:glyoxylase-like metal-dependent hydrolase (beta-lactamase superfamily II)